MAVLDNGAEVSAAAGELVDSLNRIISFETTTFQPYYDAYQTLTESEKTSLSNLPMIQAMLAALE